VDPVKRYIAILVLLIACIACQHGSNAQPSPAATAFTSRQNLELQVTYFFPASILPGVRKPSPQVVDWNLGGDWSEAEVADFLDTHTAPPFVVAQLRALSRALRRKTTLKDRVADALRGGAAETPEWRVADGVVSTVVPFVYSGSHVELRVQVRPYLVIEKG